jgi:hypothetical protein
MNNKIAIIIQGPSSNVKEQKESWESYKDNVIFSTWVGSEHLYDEIDNVIFNEPPTEISETKFNYQVLSTHNGLVRAKQLGYKYALKLRSDLIPTNCLEFLKLIDNNEFNFLCWHEHIVYENCPGYLVDFLMSGPIDKMIDLWSIDNLFCTVSEVMLTWNYICKTSDVDINYFLEGLNDENNLFWIKYDLHLSTYQKNDIYYEYKKNYFSLNHEYLNNDYLNFLK